jgi:integrase
MTTKSKGGRPAKGCIVVEGGLPWVFVTLGPKARPRHPLFAPGEDPIALRGHCAEWLDAKDAGQLVGRTELERRAVLTSAKVRNEGLVSASAGDTVEEYARRWLAVREAKGLSCVKDDRSRLKNHVYPTIGTLEMARVTRDDLRGLVELLDQRVSTGGLGWKVAVMAWSNVAKMFADAVGSKRAELRILPVNPAEGIEGPDRGVRKAKNFLWPSEFLALVSCDLVPIRWRRLFAIGAYTYARTGELEALQWEDISFDNMTIHIHSAVDRVRNRGRVKGTKTNTGRRIPVEPALLPLLKAMHDEARGNAARATGAVLTMPSPGMLSRKTKLYLAKAGVTRADLFTTDETRKGITFYDASRASGITWAAVRGDDPLRIKQRAGHASFSTTEGYIREAENLSEGFGVPFPLLPESLENGFAIGSEFRVLVRAAAAKNKGARVGATGFEPVTSSV